MDFKPFADDESAVTIGTLTVENQPDRLDFTSGFTLNADAGGLAQARALRDLLASVVDHLEALQAKGALPDRLPDAEPEGRASVDNPFA